MEQSKVQFLMCHAHPQAPGRLHANGFPSVQIGADVLVPVSAVSRAGGSVKLKGTLQADPSKRVVGTPQVTAIISFEGGGTLRRAP